MTYKYLFSIANTAVVLAISCVPVLAQESHPAEVLKLVAQYEAATNASAGHSASSIEIRQTVVNGTDSSSHLYIATKYMKGDDVDVKVDSCPLRPDGARDEAFHRRWREIVVGETTWRYDAPWRSDSASITKSSDHATIGRARASYGGALDGYFYGNSGKSLLALLKDSQDIHLDPAVQNIGGVSCQLIQGRTKFGTFQVWLAPEKGYNAIKVVLMKTSSDVVDVKPLASPRFAGKRGDELTGIVQTLDEVKVDQVNGVFVPTAGRLVVVDSHKGGKRFSDEQRYTKSGIELAPDLIKLKAFIIDAPDGTEAHDLDDPNSGVKYNWHEGRVQAALDKKTELKIDSAINAEKVAGQPSSSHGGVQ